MSDTFLTIAYAIAAGSIGFAFVQALTYSGQRRDRIFFFGAVLLALLIHVLGQLLLISGAYELAPHLVGVDSVIKMALGPAVFFYTRALVSPEKPRFGRLDWMWLLGPVLIILVWLPFGGLSAEEKLALVDPATRNPVHFRMAIFTCTASLVVFIGFTALYLIAALRLQMRHRRTMMEQFANIERKSLDWLRAILFVFAVAWVFFAIKQVLWVTGTSIPAFNLALAYIETFAIAAFAYLGLQQPDLLFERASRAQTRRPILSDERMSRTAAKLIRALNTNRLYADSDLSLRALSDITGVTKNHISETLSQHLGVNFFDFVNSHRASEARRLLKETDLSILEIALEVGFNSRSTFNAAFKKHVGSPPSTYRENPHSARALDAA
ncbi:helix-turn-helix transcriptional regulator [Hyphobacterium indicum]|uniref:helix-turn-helix transcriptional regulator n=1 Tax=Hyphobacterium indicum TaxID=2162714 RepID=UPI000D65799A|nr:AraC family transcriptional regulator [Hyphobacterium indicum]